MGDYALGYYSEPHKVGEQADIKPPEMALGRKPRRSGTSSAVATELNSEQS